MFADTMSLTDLDLTGQVGWISQECRVSVTASVVLAGEHYMLSFMMWVLGLRPKFSHAYLASTFPTN